MPRKSKKARFRGVQKQCLSPPSSINPASSSLETCAPNPEPTVSQSKLERNQHNTSLDDSSQSESNGSTSTGYRLIDLECLKEAMSNLHMCSDGKWVYQ